LSPKKNIASCNNYGDEVYFDVDGLAYESNSFGMDWTTFESKSFSPIKKT